VTSVFVSVRIRSESTPIQNNYHRRMSIWLPRAAARWPPGAVVRRLSDEGTRAPRAPRGQRPPSASTRGHGHRRAPHSHRLPLTSPRSPAKSVAAWPSPSNPRRQQLCLEPLDPFLESPSSSIHFGACRRRLPLHLKNRAAPSVPIM
jgi:hypothetical protein